VRVRLRRVEWGIERERQAFSTSLIRRDGKDGEKQGSKPVLKEDGKVSVICLSAKICGFFLAYLFTGHRVPVCVFSILSLLHLVIVALAELQEIPLSV
jgi:hypothetical protein